MTPRRFSDQSRRAAAIDGIGVGMAMGIIAGFVLFLLERGGSVPGTHAVTILSLYLACGALAGLIGGGVTSLVTYGAGVSAARVAAIPVSVAAAGGLLTAVFMLRDYGLGGYQEMPGVVLGNAVLSIALWGAIGVTGTRVARRRELATGRRTARLLVIATVLPAIGVGIVGMRQASRLPGRHTDGFGQPNIVLVVVGSLRPDHLGVGRYDRPTSPGIDALAEEGIVFDNAYAHASDDALSFASIVTGRYPVTRLNARRRRGKAQPSALDALAAAGYTSVAIGGGPLGDAERVAGWFDRVESFRLDRYRLSLVSLMAAIGMSRPPVLQMDGEPVAGEVTTSAIRWIDRLGDRPYVLTVRFSDVTPPRLPPADVLAPFDRGSSRHDPHSLYLMADALSSVPAPLSVKQGDLEAMIDVYDASTYLVDASIGRLIEHVESRTGKRETIVIVTADRGEEFMEHGGLINMSVVTEELVRVPLIVWSSAGLVPRRVAGLVRHVDLLPTLAALCGAEATAGLPGHSLLGFLDGSAGQSAGETVACGSGVTAINTPDWKIVRVDSTQAYYLFNLKDDPWARDDVAAAHPDVLAALKRRLDFYDDATEPPRSRSWTDN